MGVFGGDIGGKGRWGNFGAAGSGVESGREAQACVVLSKGLGGGPMVLYGVLISRWIERRGLFCQRRFCAKTSEMEQQ